MARMQERGETHAAIAELAGVKVGEVRTVLMAANARPSARLDALGAATTPTSRLVMALRHRQWVWMWGSRRGRMHEVRLAVRRAARPMVSVRSASASACDAMWEWRCGSIRLCMPLNANGSTFTL